MATRHRKKFILSNLFEAGMVQEYLNYIEADYFMKCYEDSAYGMLYQMDQGWGFVEVDPEIADKVYDLILDVRSKVFTTEEIIVSDEYIEEMKKSENID